MHRTRCQSFFLTIFLKYFDTDMWGTSFQHNGAGTVSISNFYASDFGKLYRACGNCDVSHERHVIVNNAKLDSGSAGVGINTNWGDTAKISNVCTTGKPTLASTCLFGFEVEDCG